LHPDKVSSLQDELSGLSVASPTQDGKETWNTDTLNSYMSDLDMRISFSNYESAVILTYTCLESFLKAFVEKNIPTHTDYEDLISLSKTVISYFQENFYLFPDEITDMLNHIAHTVVQTRNKFSEPQYDEIKGNWLSVFLMI